jgi:pimeloyl-ACP methyl ester carboxylesterase
VVLTVGLALLAGCAGGASSTATTATPGGPGRFQGQVDIGDGRKLYLSCSGRGTPTVILESGYHDSSGLWSVDEPAPPAVGPSVQDRLAERVRVCSYDRPGTLVYGTPLALTTLSTPVAQPRSAGAAVRDLHALVGAAKLTTPVVIVAHSFGGLLTQLYAQTYPKEVAGVVFVDAFPATVPQAMGDQWPAYQQLLASPGTALDADPAFERFDVDASVAEVKAAPSLPVDPHRRPVQDRAVPGATDQPDRARPADRVARSAAGSRRPATRDAAHPRHGQRPLLPGLEPRPRRRHRAAGDRPDRALTHTGPVTTTRITLIGRPGCHLCDDARGVVEQVATELDVGWDERSIDDDPSCASSGPTTSP